MLKHKAYKFRIYPTKEQEILIAKTFASSQLCSSCGHQHKDVKHLGLREWTCPNCGIHHDRDVNAGLNLKREAERILVSSTVGTTGLA